MYHNILYVCDTDDEKNVKMVTRHQVCVCERVCVLLKTSQQILVFVCVSLSVLLSQGRGTSSDPSKSDQEEDLSSIPLTFDGSGSQ